jgi:hypothetical protein
MTGGGGGVIITQKIVQRKRIGKNSCRPIIQKRKNRCKQTATFLFECFIDETLSYYSNDIHAYQSYPGA